VNVRAYACASCGAPVDPRADRCPYCQQVLIHEGRVQPPQNQADPTEAAYTSVRGIVFSRVMEPVEGAFSLAVPKGWSTEGGIQRADLTHQVIDAQSIEAKLDFSVKQDTAGSVMIRWCPEMKYCDLRSSPAGMMGFFPPGSNYQGMTVSPVLPAREFLVNVVFPWAHPQACDVRLVAEECQPLLVNRYRERTAALTAVPTEHFQYDAAVMTFRYTEDGQPFEEKAQTIIENMGLMAGGMWSNKDTLLIRAPVGELATWEPILRHIQESVQIDPRWLAREIVNQEFLSRSFRSAQQASIARDRRMLEIQQEIQAIDRQITEHRMETNAEIMNDNYLTLMDLEEYVNPYTNEPEVGSNQWHHRWVTEDGTEFYTDLEQDDPNIAGLLNRTDWRRTPVRPRRPL
jgi:DNA-directed RNA polymerase subunit RPC12/RpoP